MQGQGLSIMASSDVSSLKPPFVVVLAVMKPGARAAVLANARGCTRSEKRLRQSRKQEA
jgi:hypothetical protein